MKRLQFPTLVLAIAAICQTSTAHDAPTGTKKFTILLVEDGLRWQLVFGGDGNLHFYRFKKRERLPGDKVSEPFRTDCHNVEIAGESGGWMTMEGCGAFAGGYLTADYSTTPPSVKVRIQQEKNATWKLIDTGETFRGDKEFYIQNLNDQGKGAWLSLGSDSLLFPIGHVDDAKEVRELRNAIVSFGKKPKFIIVGGANDGK